MREKSYSQQRQSSKQLLRVLLIAKHEEKKEWQLNFFGFSAAEPYLSLQQLVGKVLKEDAQFSTFAERTHLNEVVRW